MFGKIFESLYTGSMVGSGAIVFAVWGYVIANMKPDEEVGAQVELNPNLLNHILGEEQEDVEKAIEFLCSPDESSRSKDEDGRRLIRIGQFAYRVVNGPAYMKIRNEEDRREYFRVKKQEQRQRERMKRFKRRPIKTMAERAIEAAEKNGDVYDMERAAHINEGQAPTITEQLGGPNL